MSLYFLPLYQFSIYSFVTVFSVYFYFFILFLCFIFIFLITALSLVRNSGRLYRVRYAQQPQEERHPFLPVCAVFTCVRTMAWLPVFGLFNVRTDVDTCDCTRGLYGHRERVCSENRLWEKNPLSRGGLEPASVLRLAFPESDHLPR